MAANKHVTNIERAVMLFDYFLVCEDYILTIFSTMPTKHKLIRNALQ